MKKALVVGDLFFTQSAKVDALPKVGDNLVLRDLRVDFSGVGANIARNLVRLGVRTRLFGAVGRDQNGKVMLETLHDAGVDVRLVERLKRPTGSFLVLIDRKGERTMIGTRGASETVSLRAELLERRPDWVHVSGYTLLNRGQVGAFSRFLSAASRAGVPLSVDLEGVAQEHRKLDLRGATVLCNLSEYKEYFGRDALLNDCGAKALVVKAGREGAYVLGHEGSRLVRGSGAKAVDSTGAGDAFDAGFIKAKLSGSDDYTACVWGDTCGSLKVAKPGPFLTDNLATVKRLVSLRLHP